MQRAAIVGAAGYTGVELARLLLAHPNLTLGAVTSTTDAGRPVEEVYPGLTGCGLTFVEPDPDAIAAEHEVVFLAVPHTAAMDMAAGFLDAGLKVVDLSADFRLSDPVMYERWYDTPHTSPGLLSEAVYGLPELYREALASADLVACPGCYPTASILACAPALESGAVEPGRVVIDAKSGVSGAGRSPSATTHFCAVNESVAPYKVASHRHTPEIAQVLSAVAEADVSVAFAPHLVPMTRGLLATAYLDAMPDLNPEEAEELYRARYEGEPFVTVHPAGRMPSTREVCGTNRAHIGLVLDPESRTLVVACAIDNLVKGSGGQAVQAANIALGLDETAGLTLPAPVV